MKILAERLKWLREKERLSQKEIASDIGISLNGYQKIEQGSINPKIDTLIRICECLNQSSDFLLGLSDYTKELQFLSVTFASLEKELEDKKDRYMNEFMKSKDEQNEELLDMLSDELRDVEFTYKNIFKDFLLYIYRIPLSEPERDKYIGIHHPFEPKMTYNNLFQEWMISIKGKGISLDNFEIVASEEEAKEKVDYYKNLLRLVESDQK